MVDQNTEVFNWPPLESNPEIFEEYMNKVGLPKEWTFGEIYGFEEDLLAFIPRPVLAVIINAERLKKTEDKQKGDASVPVEYYMKQTEVLDNACGVIACLHAILNSSDQVKLAEDSILGKLKESAKSMTPEERATALENNTEFQNAHKSHASQGQSNQASEQSEVKHHFVAFAVNKNKQLVEFDGTKVGPLVIAENCEDVLMGSIKEIQRRLADGEISESLSMMTLNGRGE
eukprot:CAMPEP_0176378178 /NCGR_PEP_ID=MMETSP0126-20121128/29419_1 /TAXON_ID=141414 ORGANISM="Strombidinopsis acuminatum, Strain SPMC142" /NCGR_SAMPLE_ID=MMETSP0126 /ASSEMBLY_ACC=CAM_ASM_000229 /LENGTH=230 /DNA_ID=CAMNT_0017740337 /DNA_START=37 /DNA_END=729 /DNA_ORIENTATION=+